MSNSSPLQRLAAAEVATLAGLEALEQAARQGKRPHLAGELASDRVRVEGGLYIAVVGAFSSGKTTFVNAILGEELLPTHATPTTATITEVHNGLAKTASVVLKTEEFLREERERAIKRTEELKALDERTGAQDTELSQLAAIVDLDPEFTYPGGLPRSFRLDDPSHREKVNQFLSEGAGSLAPYTERVRLEVPMDAALMPENVVLVDTPGSNSFSALHRNATYRALTEADCVLFFLNARAPLSSSDLELLADVNAIRTERGFERDRFIFVVNAIDEIDPDAEDRDEVIAYVRAQLEERGVEQPRVEGASSLVAFLARLHAAGGALTRRQRRLLMEESDDQPEAGLTASGVGNVLDLLWSTVGKDSGASLLTAALRRADARHQQLQCDHAAQLLATEESVDKARGVADGLTQVVSRKRRQRRALQERLEAIVSDGLKGLSDSAELQRRLLEVAKSLRDSPQLGSSLGIETRAWLQHRLRIIGDRVGATGIRVQEVLAEALQDIDTDGREHANGMPRVQPVAFNILFDVPRLESPDNGSIGGPTSFGAILGGLIGFLAGGPAGALMGGAIAAGIVGSAAAEKVKAHLAAGRRHQDAAVKAQAAKVDEPLNVYLQRCADALVRWALDGFDGYLNDLEAQLARRLELARQATMDSEATKARLANQGDGLERCKTLIEEAQAQVSQLS